MIEWSQCANQNALVTLMLQAPTPAQDAQGQEPTMEPAAEALSMG